MPKFRMHPKNHIGDPSSKYAYDKDGSKFEADLQKSIEKSKLLYKEFVEFMKSKDVSPDVFRGLFLRYYKDFIKGERE